MFRGDGSLFLIDRFESADLLPVLRLAQRSLGEELPFDFFLRLATLRPEFTRVARDPRSGDVCGFIVGTKEGGMEGRVVVFAVDPGYQGLGVGRQLLRALQREMVMEDVRQVRLEVRADNRRAISFYRRHGFQVSGLQERAYKDGQDAYNMTKPLR